MPQYGACACAAGAVSVMAPTRPAITARTNARIFMTVPPLVVPGCRYDAVPAGKVYRRPRPEELPMSGRCWRPRGQRGAHRRRGSDNPLVCRVERRVLRRHRATAVERSDLRREIQQGRPVEPAAAQPRTLGGSEPDVLDPTTPAWVGHPPTVARHVAGEGGQRSV